MEDTIKIKYTEQPEVTLSSQENERINKDFLIAYQLKQHVTAIPTYTPKNFFDQIVFYNNGATFRLYLYINGTWRYTNLT